MAGADAGAGKDPRPDRNPWPDPSPEQIRIGRQIGLAKGAKVCWKGATIPLRGNPPIPPHGPTPPAGRAMNAPKPAVLALGATTLLAGCPLFDDEGKDAPPKPSPAPLKTWAPPTPAPAAGTAPSPAEPPPSPASSSPQGLGREWDLAETWVNPGRWGFQGYPELQGGTSVTATANGFTSHRVHTAKDGTPRADWDFSYRWEMPARIVERLDPGEPDFTLHVEATARRNSQPAPGNFIDCARVEARGFTAVPADAISFGDQWGTLRDGEATTSQGDWRFWIEGDVPDEFTVAFHLCTDTVLAKYTYRLVKERPPADAAPTGPDMAALVAQNEARYIAQDEREGAHEFYEPSEGMRRIPGTADPRFFCHDFAWRPADRRTLPPDPTDIAFHNGHVDPDRVVSDPAAHGFEEIHDPGRLAPGDIACYVNGDNRNHIDHSALVVSTTDGALLHSKDVRNSIFEHRLGAPGERNFFRDRYGATTVRFFRRR